MKPRVEDFCDLLFARAGIDPAAMGKGMIESGVRQRMRACSAPDMGAYLLKAQASEEEFSELVLAVTVPETWFFREPESFRLLDKFASSRRWRSRPFEPLRALSIPCCTGEEPYSISMALFDAGLSQDEFSIDAMDIHPAFLETARRASYGKNSFRGLDEEIIRRHFRIDGDRFLLREGVARQVRFSQGDALKLGALVLGRSYHVVFCRNLMIYLHADARQRLLHAIDHCLAEGGLLFAGHSETIPSSLFRPVHHSFSFAYARAPREDSTPRGPKAQAPTPLRLSDPVQRAARPAFRPHHRIASTGAEPSGAVRRQRACWQSIGIDGDKSCSRLSGLVHCRNCDVFSEAARSFFERDVPEGYREECLRDLASSMEAEPGSTLQVVVFRLGENRLAIPTSALKRIDTVPRIHRIPHCGSRLLGMAMADGDLHLCADLSAVLGLGPGGAPGEASRLLIVERESEAWAFIADEAAQMASWDPGHKTAPPPGPAAEYASGAWDHDGRRVLLLDEELLFGALQRCLK